MEPDNIVWGTSCTKSRQKGIIYGLELEHQGRRGDVHESHEARGLDGMYIRARLPLPDRKLPGAGGHHGPS
eukprot:12202529-Heterocapsa_arctica.AAC.1